METFTEAREFGPHASFADDRRAALAALELASIDEPIRDIVAGFAALPGCFPLQSCYGHFLCQPGQDDHSLERVTSAGAGPVRYRIAYLAVCLEDSPPGRTLREALARIPAVDPAYIQFGSADWFWEQWVNTYALQVEPLEHKLRDEAVLSVAEALRVQRARDVFCGELRRLLASGLAGPSARR